MCTQAIGRLTALNYCTMNAYYRLDRAFDT
jgi:hypothetical protein